MTTTGTLPILDVEKVLANLHDLRQMQPVKFSAFYSSHLGGVVTDPALMVIPFDDHIVHRGHGVFDTAAIANGKIYDLEAHLDRFLRSAASSKLALPFSREKIRSIIIQTTAISNQKDGSIRYWLSSGTGNLGLVPAANAKPGFFVMIFPGLDYDESYYTKGMRVMTTTYPIKPSLYAVTKSTNYLPNVLMQLEAKEKGLDNGVFIDANGNVGEGSNMNMAFVTKDNVLRHPKFDHILSGCTVLRLLELATVLVQQGLINGVQIGDIPATEAKKAKEMMLIGSSIYVAPVVEWDGKIIGDGKPGPVAKALLEILREDMKSGKGKLTEIPANYN